MVKIEKPFHAVVNDFVDSAETEEELTLFLVIALAGWNLSLRPDEEREDWIQIVIERFDCPFFTWKGKKIETRAKILELCARKEKMFPKLRRVITSFDAEDSKTGLRYSIASKAVQ